MSQMDRSDNSASIDDRDDIWDTGCEPAFAAGLDDDAIDAPQAVAGDERRLHVRAYAIWADLLEGRALPAITDLEPASLAEFNDFSVLLHFDGAVGNPTIAYLGPALRIECGIAGKVGRLDQVPARSLLTRLTDHYLQIIANAAPIGFEAEFTNQRGADIVYRGILMPFSSDGALIDYIYGVLSWKEVAEPGISDALEAEVRAVLTAPPFPRLGRSPWDETTGSVDFSDDDSLADRLALARRSAEDAAAHHARSRRALYEAIGAAHDFALACEDAPEDLAELLDDAGIAVQPRAPMTAIAELVFGNQHDKTRLAEIAMILDHGKTTGVLSGELAFRLLEYPGGMKKMLADIRAARADAGEDRADPIDLAFDRLKDAPALLPEMIGIDPGSLGILVARREADGSLSIVAALEDNPLSGRMPREAAKTPTRIGIPTSSDTI